VLIIPKKGGPHWKQGAFGRRQRGRPGRGHRTHAQTGSGSGGGGGRGYLGKKEKKN